MENPPKPPFASSPLALHFFGLSILAYGWQLHGVWAGAGLSVLFYLLIPVLNFVALAKFGSLRLGTYLRVATFLVFMIGLMLSAAQVCEAGGECRNVL